MGHIYNWYVIKINVATLECDLKRCVLSTSNINPKLNRHPAKNDKVYVFLVAIKNGISVADLRVNEKHMQIQNHVTKLSFNIIKYKLMKQKQKIKLHQCQLENIYIIVSDFDLSYICHPMYVEYNLKV